MPTARINKSTVDAVRVGSKDVFLWDEKIPGFGLKVTPAGSRVYLYQYRLHGGRGAKVRRYTIGKHGALTPDQARGEANRLSMLVAQGVDPQSDKIERKRQTIDLAFPTYLDAFAKDCLAPNWKGSAGGVEAMLRRYALPALRSKALPEITRVDVAAIMRPVKARPALASKLFAVLRYLFRHAVSEGDLARSPMDGMKSPSAPAARDRVLEDWELALIWNGSAAVADPFGSMVRLLMLTGQRREEVAGLPWSELRQTDAMWKLPADRAKNGQPVDTPLSTAAVLLLTALAKGGNWPRRGWVISTTGKVPFSGYSKAKKRLDAEIAKLNTGEVLERWTLHDLRRTLATGMQRLGVRFEVTEAILNHVSGSRSGVAGVYQRHDWGPEKARALQSWSDHIEGLLTASDKSNVVQFAEARA
ncbi:integrase arm-type DNA-binding domain-containing protein [Altererythrobacter aerius]|uniref:Integrase arm-type DNA-binding domain-containing protein n=1 Tax=Tsuneonella aeria TaxID=1837929 RepID=A0A6I4TCB9_9SPHN|nr:integrase family protein [Tsuneonella aeria]MXO74852.1 integrase arm-type DNA-binding domain-containing protein [Tsuneonella aeria]